MFKCLFALLIAAPLIAQVGGGSRHFLGISGPLTGPSSQPALAIAQDYLQVIAAKELSLSSADLAGVYVAKEYKTEHNGVTHIVYKQQFQGADVYNAEWVVNIAADGSILNAGGTLFSAPPEGAALPPISSAGESAIQAVKHMNTRAAENFSPIPLVTGLRKNSVTLAGGVLPDDIEGTLVWYGDQGALRPGWVFYMTDVDGIQRYATVVDNATQTVRAQQPLTFFQSASSGLKALVFERESPQPNPTPGVRLSAPPPIVDRTLQPLTGDPKASPNGWVSGNQTAGNNAVVGENLLGTLFSSTATLTTTSDGVFSFPLQLGAGAPSPLTFTNAANTNLFYWINRAHDLHYLSGFDEAAGNYQANNLGRGGTDGDPIYAYTHYGAQSPSSAQIENAFFTTRGTEDGSQSMVAMFLSQSNNYDFFTDGAYDSAIIVHEYTHGVSERLVRQGYTTFQGQAMGEAWSDFYGLEYTLPAGAPPDGIYALGEYFDQSWGTGDVRTRPYSTDINVNPLTYANLGHVITFPEVHSDGEIWFEALWEIRANLIKQLGEAEGRRRVRLLVIDGMKLSVPAPSMVDMRDAILLADRVDFRGASQNEIWAGFAKRGLGALAYSSGGQTVHAVSSFDLPSQTGQLKFYDDPLVIGEAARIVLQDSSLNQPTVRIAITSSSGDIENLDLRQQGSIYIGSLATTGTPNAQYDNSLSLATGDAISAYYTHFGPPSNRQMSVTAAIQLPYTLIGEPQTFTFGIETPLRLTGTYRRVDLPFQFPFFSNSYGSVLVHRNGLLSFDLPIASSCTDVGTLSSFNGLSPLWANLITTGTAQKAEDVYLSQPSADSVTFHWVAETRTPTAGPGQPVNFAATLYRSGLIEFSYDQKSNSLLNFDASYYGCGIGPIFGISNGHNSYTQAFVFDTNQGLGGANYRFEPPWGASSLPVITLESPTPDQQAQGILTVAGIAYDTNGAVTRIDEYIDGRLRFRTTPTISRPDFCAGPNASVNGCPRVGFSNQLDLSSLSILPGSHTLTLRVTNSRGGFTDVDPVSFTVIDGQSRLPRAKIESPANGDTVSGSITVRGWALADDLRIAGVDLLIDGVTNNGSGLIYGLARTDVCNAQSTKPPNCPGVGFTATISTKDSFPLLVDGQHTIMVRVRDESGRYSLLEDTAVTFNIKNPSAQIVAVLNSPQNNATLSGTVTLSGYAYSPGQRIIGALVIVDETVFGSARINQPAADVCATLTSPPAACPNIGFTFSLDTTHLLNGPHILGIEIVNDLGDFVIIPTLVSSGMNVFVQN